MLPLARPTPAVLHMLEGDEEAAARCLMSPLTPSSPAMNGEHSSPQLTSYSTMSASPLAAAAAAASALEAVHPSMVMSLVTAQAAYAIGAGILAEPLYIPSRLVNLESLSDSIFGYHCRQPAWVPYLHFALKVQSPDGFVGQCGVFLERSRFVSPAPGPLIFFEPLYKDGVPVKDPATGMIVRVKFMLETNTMSPVQWSRFMHDVATVTKAFHASMNH